MLRVVNRFEELCAIKGRREGRKITRRIVAEETGVSLSSVQAWAGNTLLFYGVEQIAAFCEYFDCKVGELLVMEAAAEAPENENPLLVA